MDFNGLMKECKDNPLLCLLGIVLLLAVIQNCVMDIGLGPYLGMEGFADLLGEDVPTDAGPAPSAGLGLNEVSAPVDGLNRTPSTCYPQEALKPEDLLPKQESQAIKEFNTSQPVGEGILQGVNLLDAGFHVGVNTIGQSLRNANRQLRSEPANPQVDVSPWQNSTIGPDLGRKPLETTECSA